ncbi:hypothetical protein [Sphingomonas sp.]|jgi:hypothetical protein|uniref:hypothetical protein n=1 Tax=Sphingomonas sp. TaxID=28214 RepID=UPI002DEF77B2|nr:hypothetical protein [Sphingomonas sp.]
MAYAKLFLALSIIAAPPAWGAMQERPVAAPAGGPDTRYCMRMEALTGTITEQVKCWTRDEWANQGVDVDVEWPREGVRVLG